MAYKYVDAVAKLHHPSVRRKAYIGSRKVTPLLPSLGGQRFYHCDILQQVLRQTMSLLQIRCTVVANPDLGLQIVPHQDLERKVKGDAGRSQHQGCARLRTPEN